MNFDHLSILINKLHFDISDAFKISNTQNKMLFV